MIKLFVSYAREDFDVASGLIRYLKGINNRSVNVYWDEVMTPGVQWEQELENQVMASDIFLFLISNYSLQSDTCKKEISWFKKKVRPVIIPIHIEDCSHIDNDEFNGIHALPLAPKGKDIKPIRDWSPLTKAYSIVAAGVKKQVDELLKQREKDQKTIDLAKQKERGAAGQNAMTEILARYLASFGSRLEDLEHLSHKEAIFPYYYKAEKIVFEPLSLQDGIETAMLRLETYAFKHSGAPFHTYVIPYYIQKRNDSDGGIVVDDLQALKALAAQHQGLTRIHIVDTTLY
jgi:hypothetical protein